MSNYDEVFQTINTMPASEATKKASINLAIYIKSLEAEFSALTKERDGLRNELEEIKSFTTMDMIGQCQTLLSRNRDLEEENEWLKARVDELKERMEIDFEGYKADMASFIVDKKALRARVERLEKALTHITKLASFAIYRQYRKRVEELAKAALEGEGNP